MKRKLFWKLFSKNTGKNIFIRLLLLTLLPGGCTLPLFPDKEPDLASFLQNPPLAGNSSFAIYHLSPEFNSRQVLTEITTTAQTVQRRLHLSQIRTPVSVILFSANDPIGKHYLHKSGTRHHATGHYSPANRILFVTGKTDDPRFHTILRHEAVHAVLHSSIKGYLPFWFDEGVASFFEQDENIEPVPGRKNERLTLLQYHLHKGEGLNFAELVNNPYEKKRSGIAYARSWGLVACLYKEKRNIMEYLENIENETVPPGGYFAQTLLQPDESIDTFEKSCSDWLLSL